MILDRSSWPVWLGETGAERVDLLALLKPCPADRMRTYAIGPRIGNVRNDEQSLLEPMEGIGP